MDEVGGDNFRMQMEGGARRAHAREFFRKDGAEAEITANPAIFLRHCAAEETAFTGFAPDFAADLSGLFPFRMEGDNAFLDKAAGGGAEKFMFFFVDVAFHDRPVFLFIFLGSAAGS